MGRWALVGEFYCYGLRTERRVEVVATPFRRGEIGCEVEGRAYVHA